MPGSALFRRNRERLRANYAAELGCDPAAFDSHELTLVARPESARSRDPAFVVTFGTGTVVRVASEYLDWALQHPPERHFHAFNTSGFLANLRAEMERGGLVTTARGTGLGFVAERLPRSPSLPASTHHRLIDADWRARYHPDGEFHNALGDADDAYADSYWRFGVSLVDSAGRPLAVAGAYDDGPGLLEIGVDVRRDHRGQGLAAAVVTLISREIHLRGLTATYYCAASNVRSHRTALAAGFVPVATNTGLRLPPEATPA